MKTEIKHRAAGLTTTRQIAWLIAILLILSGLSAVAGCSKKEEPQALAPLAVAPSFHGTGIGGALVREAHIRLKEAGEKLSVVLGDPAYYGRFGYAHGRAAGFDSEYQGAALQALAWGKAPDTGKLVYAAAFSPELAA